MNLTELSALHGGARDQHAVLTAALDGAAPVLNVHHAFRAVLRTVPRAALYVAKMGVLLATVGRTGLKESSESVEVLHPR